MKQGRAVIILVLLLHGFLFLFSAAYSGAHQHKKLLNLHRFQLKHKKHQKNAVFPSCFSHKPRRQEHSSNLEIKNRDSCFRQATDVDKSLQERVIVDNNQVQFLQSRMRRSISGELQTLKDTRVPLSSGARLEILNYVITMTLGGKNMTVIVDTGSDLTWVQCQPCRSCYTQQEPLFNPSVSPSYRSIACSSSTCKALQEATGNNGACPYKQSTCNYYVSYGDGSYTRGELGKEHLSLGTASVNNFLFGCGRSNKGLFGGASGLMGLGKSALSVVTQTSKQFGGIFSYCLPSSDLGDSGSLTMGGNSSAYRNTTAISYTRMVQSPGLSTFYMLNLTGMNIGGVDLNASSFGQKGVLIDSGTVITRLPPSMYTALKAEFTKQFSGFPSAPGFSILDTCFNLSTYETVNIPTVRLQFEGNAEMTVDVNGVFYFVKADASQTCLAFASLTYEDEIAIIGNYQQKNLRVVYDTKNSMIGFAEEQCSFA